MAIEMKQRLMCAQRKRDRLNLDILLLEPTIEHRK